jgi:hypothetical protein
MRVESAVPQRKFWPLGPSSNHEIVCTYTHGNELKHMPHSPHFGDFRINSDGTDDSAICRLSFLLISYVVGTNNIVGFFSSLNCLGKNASWSDYSLNS